LSRAVRLSVLAPNTPEVLEGHFGVPLADAVLNTINTRLDAPAIAFIMAHAETSLLIVHTALLPLARNALERLGRRIHVVIIEGSAEERAALGASDYEAFLADADPADWGGPADEWQSIALNYTSGTTGNPKGVVYSHRGAYLNALGNVVSFGLRPDSVYLWTLPMFHCNGWTYPWAVTAVGARHICLPVVDPAEIFRLIAEHRVTHLCAAPVVLTMLIHSAEFKDLSFAHGPVDIATGGAAPPSTVIAAMEGAGFRLTHLYGLTESYGPATACVPQDEWEKLDNRARAMKMARQGVRNLTVSRCEVRAAGSPHAVPADGRTLGEVLIRSNSVMKGYINNATATEEALKDGWLHTGDLAVIHADGYVEIKDRAKDIIISGGENISSLEVEEVLYDHPEVMEAAVVAAPDAKWGETPWAFVALRPGSVDVTEADVLAFCRDRLARFKCPRKVVFGPLPKTSTGKIQKMKLRQLVMNMRGS
jgi:fatty-acyl-CoA synthase